MQWRKLRAQPKPWCYLLQLQFCHPWGTLCATTDPPQSPSFMTFLCEPSGIPSGLAQAGLSMCEMSTGTRKGSSVATPHPKYLFVYSRIFFSFSCPLRGTDPSVTGETLPQLLKTFPLVSSLSIQYNPGMGHNYGLSWMILHFCCISTHSGCEKNAERGEYCHVKSLASFRLKTPGIR